MNFCLRHAARADAAKEMRRQHTAGGRTEKLNPEKGNLPPYDVQIPSTPYSKVMIQWHCGSSSGGPLGRSSNAVLTKGQAQRHSCSSRECERLRICSVDSVVVNGKELILLSLFEQTYPTTSNQT